MSSFEDYQVCNWEKLPQKLDASATARPRDMASDGNGVFVVVFESGYASRSADGGDTWTELTRGLNSGTTTDTIRGVGTDGQGNWVAVFNQGWAARSTDNGATWSALTRWLNSGGSTSSHNLLSVAGDSSGRFVVGGAYGYCARSTDDGATWSALTRGLNSGASQPNIRTVAHNGSGAWVAASSAGWASRSIDNGATWTSLTQGLNTGLTDCVFARVRFGKSNVGVATAESSGRMARTTDGGATWTSQYGFDLGVYAADMFGLGNDGDDVWFAGGANGVCMMSEDNAATWTRAVDAFQVQKGTATRDIQTIQHSDGVFVATSDNAHASKTRT